MRVLRGLSESLLVTDAKLIMLCVGELHRVMQLKGEFFHCDSVYRYSVYSDIGVELNM